MSLRVNQLVVDGVENVVQESEENLVKREQKEENQENEEEEIVLEEGKLLP